MKIGIIGLGKLGYPVALAIDDAGHAVYGWDSSKEVLDMVRGGRINYKEEDADELLKQSSLVVETPEYMVKNCDIIFLAVQTPHAEKYEGITRVPFDRADFNYEYLKTAVKEIADIAEKQQKKCTLVIISTVLPGTITREIRPVLNSYVGLCYNPFFIAMGTVIHDFMHPEFVLLGIDDEETADKVKEFYVSLYSHDSKYNPIPFAEMPIIDAELTKVAYNTFIGMKIVFVNTLMEICHKNGGNVDNVTDTLKMAKDRLISTKYMTAGMGDGGGCHPRDNIAMSYLAKSLDLSHNIFEDIMKAREDQTEWLARELMRTALEYKLPIIILGKAFKPETNLTIGSPAVLLSNILKEKNVVHMILDPILGEQVPFLPAVFFIGTRHEMFVDFKFPEGSLVIDPFRYIPHQKNVKIIKIGNFHGE